MNRLIAIMAVLLVLGGVFFWLATSGGGGIWGQGKVFRIPLETNPPSLDPVKITDVTSHSIAAKLFNTLLRYDQNMKLIPDLAETLPTWDDTENSFTFKLRKGVTFHNGREMRADDVKYSFERLLDPAESTRMQILEVVKGAKKKIDGKGEVTEAEGLVVVDDYTFKIVLERPDPTFLHSIIMVNAAVVPKEAVEAAKADGQTFSQQPVGTGPFKFVRWEANNVLEFARFDDYFDGKPKLDGVRWEIVKQPQARLEKFLKGEYEVCDIPTGRFKQMMAKHPDLVSKNETFRTNYLGISIRRPVSKDASELTDPLGKNATLRQAINHAIDRKNICDEIMEGRSLPAQCIVPPGMMAHNPDLKAWTHDLEKSKALLAEAGFPGGEGLRPLVFMYREDPDIKKMAVAIQADLEAAGFKIDLQSLDWDTFLERLDAKPPDLFILGWVADYNDPDNFLYWLFHTKQWGTAGNHTRYSDPEVDALLDKAHSSMDREERIKLYREAEQRIVADAPWCLLEFRVNYILVQPYVKGVQNQLTRMDVGWGLSYVDFSKIDLEQ